MEDNLEKSGKALGGMGVFGILYKPKDEVNLGVSLKLNTNSANTIDLMNRYYKYGSGLSAANNGFKNAYSENQAKYSSQVPAVIVLGSSWQASKKINFATDISYYTEADYNTKTYSLNTSLTKYEEKTERFELKNIINVNFGTEYMLDNNIPFRFGFYTDRSTSPKVKDNGLAQPMNVDNYGISISSGLLSQNSTMAFGIKYGWGSGRVTNLNSNGVYQIEKATTSNYAFNLSGSYNF
jgi:long-subunit fatty acid transport protein